MRANISQAGFTIVEVLAAFAILVMAISLAFSSYQSALISLSRFNENIRLSYHIPFIKAVVAEELRVSPDKLEGEFRWGTAQAIWKIKSKRSINSLPGEDLETGGVNTGAFEIALNEVSLDVRLIETNKKSTTHLYHYQELTSKKL